jgi:hypothetical protein
MREGRVLVYKNKAARARDATDPMTMMDIEELDELPLVVDVVELVPELLDPACPELELPELLPLLAPMVDAAWDEEEAVVVAIIVEVEGRTALIPLEIVD